MTLNIEHGEVFLKNLKGIQDPSKTFLINQGGRGSGKTWAILQLLIVQALTNPNKHISIVRKTLPLVKSTVIAELLSILKFLDIYDRKKHHMTDKTYTFDNGSVISWFGLDSEQKLRGRKHDLLYVNECNEIDSEEFRQLNLRTSGKILLDFNPSDAYHWVYDLILRKESLFIQSTYKDNPFLEQRIINEIEQLINEDQNAYNVFALGERGVPNTAIYSNWKYYDDSDDIQYDDLYYGLDFGFTHPTALVELKTSENGSYLKELLYKSGMDSNDLVRELESLNINKDKEIVCDNARPEIIESLKRVGFNAIPAFKNIKEGIDSVKTTKLFIHKESINLIKEISNYRWKTKGDTILEGEPVKFHDHGCDALRYVIHWVKLMNDQNKREWKVYSF